MPSNSDTPGATPERSYLICATPRSGSTLVCKALAATGIAGRPAEYYEALLHSGRPRRPQEYFAGVADQSIFDHLGQFEDGQDAAPASPLWDRAAYDRYLEWTLTTGTTPNGVFGAKLMWGNVSDFVSLLRNLPAYRDVPLAHLFQTVFPGLRFVRVIRANKIRQAVSLWKAIQTATWRLEDDDPPSEEEDADPRRRYLEEHRPQLRFHFGAIEHLLECILTEEASWDAFFEHAGIRPILVLYENFAADADAATRSVIEQLGLELPEGWMPKPRMRPQSDALNDDWARRFSELRLGRRFDLVPAVPRAPATI